MSDDITFCSSECDRTECPRHPSNIRHDWLDHSFSDLRGTAYCADAPKNAKCCVVCGCPIRYGVQYIFYRRSIQEWDWPYNAEGIGGKAGNPAFCYECEKRLKAVIMDFLEKKQKL